VTPREPEKLYCTCTKQLLRFSDEGVELLCRYCKRITLARYEELASPAGLRKLGLRFCGQPGARSVPERRQPASEGVDIDASAPSRYVRGHLGRGIEARGPRSASQ